MYLVPFNSISYPLFMRISNSMSEQEEKSATHANGFFNGDLFVFYLCVFFSFIMSFAWVADFSSCSDIELEILMNSG
jgi:hypothetical protein